MGIPSVRWRSSGHESDWIRHGTAGCYSLGEDRSVALIMDVQSAVNPAQVA